MRESSPILKPQQDPNPGNEKETEIEKENLESNNILEELDLSWNRITGEGAVLLCCAPTTHYYSSNQ